MNRFIEWDLILFKRCYVNYLKILSFQVAGLEAQLSKFQKRFIFITLLVCVCVFYHPPHPSLFKTPPIS